MLPQSVPVKMNQPIIHCGQRTIGGIVDCLAVVHSILYCG